MTIQVLIFNLLKDEKTILLALKIAVKGMSFEAITDVLEIQDATVARWLALAAEQCDKVNELIPKPVLFQINKSFMTIVHDQIFD